MGARVQPIFTPPWNRCVAATSTALAELGFRVLSRSTSVAPLAIDGLAELPIRIDWLAHRKGLRLSRAALGQLLADAIQTPGPLGVMFHHAQMDADGRGAVGELMGLLATHRAARWAPMWALSCGA